MKQPSHRIHLIIAAVSLNSAIAAAPPGRTLPVDPIELVAGREVNGKPELSLIHEGFEYQFATPENKAAFARNPSKFEVSDGGACGRMGALSGTGDARRFSVHDERIFFFASDGCRDAFLKDPARYIETDNPIPTGSAEQAAAGRATMDRLLKWAGGVERFQGLKTFRMTAARQEDREGKTIRIRNEIAIAFPDRYLKKDSWDDRWYAIVRVPKGAAFVTFKDHETIANNRRHAFDRLMARQPVVILSAYANGARRPGDAKLIVLGDGDGTIGDTPVDFVNVAMDGATTRLAVEKTEGRLIQVAFHGRDGTMSVGDSVRTFTTYATSSGITLPSAYLVDFKGKRIDTGQAFDAFDINPKLTPETWRLPEE